MKSRILIGMLGFSVMGGHIATASDWRGSYVGGEIGWHGMMLDMTATDATSIAEGVTNSGGFAGGLYAGYNFQSGSYLYGLEADVNFSNASENYKYIEGAESATINLSQKTTGTLRGRAGYIYNDFLFYGTVGIAFSKIEGDYDIALNANRLSGSVSETLTGIAFGAGAEYQISSNMVVRAGMIMTNYENLDFTDGTTNAEIAPMSRDIKIGFSYRF